MELSWFSEEKNEKLNQNTNNKKKIKQTPTHNINKIVSQLNAHEVLHIKIILEFLNSLGKITEINKVQESKKLGET